jgi:integrase
MFTTFFGCYFTEIKVVPANWKETGKKGPSTDKDWYFWYRFYDPTVKDKEGKIKPMLVIGKGMNRFKKLSDRRTYTDQLIKSELKHLQEDGFNPITSSYMIEQEDPFEGEISPDSPFIEALTKAKDLLSCTHRVKVQIKSVIKGVEKASAQLRFHDYPVCKLGRKHIKKILSRCEEISNLSPTRYNTYRGYLNMLYNELVEQEAVAGNPIRDISKRATIQKIKKVLTLDERARINDHLSKTFPRFLMFVHLFFHSGGRKTELFQLKPAAVDLEGQVYKCVIKKRKRWAEVERPIKDIALPFWEFFLKDCPKDQFIFGTMFFPGDQAMGIDMPSRYWQQYVKASMEAGGLGIDVDFYSLKHLNVTESVDAVLKLVIEAQEIAAGQTAHTSSDMVAKVYDIKSDIRKKDFLRKANNSFA